MHTVHRGPHQGAPQDVVPFRRWRNRLAHGASPQEVLPPEGGILCVNVGIPISGKAHRGIELDSDTAVNHDRILHGLSEEEVFGSLFARWATSRSGSKGTNPCTCP